MQFFGHRQGSAGEVEISARAAEAEAKEAYERGRLEERARNRRRRHPVIGLAVSLVAIAGAGVIGLAAVEGSFARSGQVIDQQLAIAAGQVQVASRDAAVATGEVVRNAGRNIRSRTTDRAG